MLELESKLTAGHSTPERCPHASTTPDALGSSSAERHAKVLWEETDCAAFDVQILVPLSSPADFSGGGTGFWCTASGGGGGDVTDDNKGAALPDGPPTEVIKPPLGSALIFGGDVTHAGMPVLDGVRSVLVASFSTRTAASPLDRVNGLQAAPSSSSLRESSF